MGNHQAVRTCRERRPCLARAVDPAPRGAPSSPDRLQQTLGNRAAGTLLAGGSRPLPVSRPDDPAEREADRLADQVLRRDEPASLAQVSPVPRIIQRQPSPDPDPEPRLPPLTLPGTGLTLFPGPLQLTDLAGLRLPLPASLRLTNALSVGSTPTFVLDVSPDLLVGTILGRLDLSTSTAPGTAPGHEEDESNQARVSLLRPIVTFDPQEGRLRGWATLSVPTQYPTSLVSPTELDLEIESTQVGRFTGRLAYGPLHADFSLRFHYDRERMERAVSPVFAPAGGFIGFWTRLQAILRGTIPGLRLDSVSDALDSLVGSLRAGRVDAAQFALRTIDLVRSSIPAGADLDALTQALEALAAELTHPGFTLGGTLGLGPIPLSAFEVSAPTTVPFARPLLGAPAPFPISASAYGVILAPPGAITDVAVPAFGYTSLSYGEVSGTNFTSAFLPTMSPTAISAGKPFVDQFPAYLYAEFSHVRRFGEDVDVGVRLTLQVSTPELFGAKEPGPTDSLSRFRLMHEQYLEATQGPGTMSVPNIGATVFGRF